MPPYGFPDEVELRDRTVRGRLVRLLGRIDRATRGGRAILFGVATVIAGLATIRDGSGTSDVLVFFPVVAGTGGVLASVHLGLSWSGRRWRRRVRAVTTRESRETLARACTAADSILDLWPELGALAGDEPVEPVLNGALFRLAGDLVERDRIREVLDRLVDATAPLSRREQDRRGLTDRKAELTALVGRLDTEIDRRIGLLVELDESCRRHLIEEAAIAASAEAAASADELLSEFDGVDSLPDSVRDPFDRAEDLAERTGTVLAAYRELRLASDSALSNQ